MIDFLIIGQGIAGTTLAHQLERKNCAFLIIDDNTPISSSKIASGLWNPVVLKRMKKVWRADEMLDKLDEFYSYVEEKLGSKIIDDKKILRLLNSKEEQNNWFEHSEKPIFENILNPDLIKSDNESVNAQNDFGEVLRSGRINVPIYLEESRKLFLSQEKLINEAFNYHDLTIRSNSIQFKDQEYKKVIFCEGYKAVNNPWFAHLPFALTKGEVLTGRSNCKITQPINGGKFILPLGNDKYKIGATYDWNELNTEPTEKGRSELIQGWNKITSAEFNIEHQFAGIRPNVKDRRPLLGNLTSAPNINIFNGLGSRGILMAPYLSSIMVSFLTEGTKIPQDMNINRF